MWHITLNIKLPDYQILGRNHQRDFIYYIEEQIRTLLYQRFKNLDISYHTDYHPDPVAARLERDFYATEFARKYLNTWEFEDDEIRRHSIEAMKKVQEMRGYQKKLIDEEDLLPKDFIKEKEMEL